MAIHCPNCKHAMSIKDAKPGRYKPKCSKCGRRFSLTIFPEAERAPLAEPLPSEPPAESSEPSKVREQTIAAAKPAAPTTPNVAPQRPSDAKITRADSVGDAAATLPAIDAAATIPMPAAKSTSAPLSNPMSSVAARETGGSTEATLVQPSSAKTQSGTEATVVAMRSAEALPNVISPAASVPAGTPDRIGGYKIVKELGKGAMGAVYLARQLSLDRDVALKTIQAQWASHPTFIARFTREAYAAAQLVHHNVVQIYDLGVDGGTNYFSMEFVRGESLDELIKRTGPLPPESAVGFILQAARGLQFAHSHGMVHRDVKPANMMVNDQGVVKIADLGLVKVAVGPNGESSTELPVSGAASGSLNAAKADVTLANVAMGTPAYMAPEQADNAAGVDHRADIYSLGCSLYVMLTGKPPFEGASAIEVMTKHRMAPVVRPDVMVSNIPKELADITLKMVAKQPEQRYQNLADVIQDLERFVGGGTSNVGLTQEQAALIDRESKRFHNFGLAKLRGLTAAAFIGGCAVLFLVLLLFSWSLAGAILGLAGSAVVAYFIATGLTSRSPLFDRTRAVVFAARWSDWLTWAGAGLVFLLFLWLIGSLWLWIAAGVLGVLLGLGYSFAVDRRLAKQRHDSLENIESLLRAGRVKGMDETQLRLFVAQHSGNHWEELFETLFGYEAKLAARSQVAQSVSGTGYKFRAWREPLTRWLDRRLIADREQRDRRHLQKLEEQNLRSQGVEAEQARQQAGRIAVALVGDAAAARVPSAKPSPAVVDPAVAAAEKRERIKRMLAEAKAGASSSKGPGFLTTALAPAAFVLSGKVRFLLGCMLLIGCALWAKQNDLVSQEKLQSVATNVTENLQAPDVKNLTNTIKLQKAEALRLPMVGRFFDSWYPGIAGLMLIFLGLFRGWKMSLFALPAAACIVIGPAYGGPRVVMLLVGVVLGAVGLVFGRSGH